MPPLSSPRPCAAVLTPASPLARIFTASPIRRTRFASAQSSPARAPGTRAAWVGKPSDHDPRGREGLAGAAREGRNLHVFTRGGRRGNGHDLRADLETRGIEPLGDPRIDLLPG